MSNERKLREALQRYGKHEHNCASNNYRFKCACDCGLEEALALPITPPAAAPAPAVPVYLVATGEVYEGQETYTRHDVRPPLCDAELLYTTPTAQIDQAVAKAATEEREACAKVCDIGAEQMLHAYKREGAARCAAAIRARSNT